MISHLSQPSMSPLRAHMIEDMTVRGFSEKTRHDYVRKVRAFAAFIGRSPDTATAEDLRRFQLHQTQSGMQPPSVNSTVSALRFLFTVTLDRPDLARRLTIVHQPRRLPAVLSVEEIVLLLQAAPGPKYKAALATAYSAGLRVSEVVALKLGDIDSERMVLRVERGKGGKDRHAMLSPQLLAVLIFFTVFTGIRQVDGRLVERVLTLGGDRWALVRHVYLPSVASWVLGSLKVAVGFAFTGACVGEFVAASRGLGYLLSFAQSTYNAALMFALILLILAVVLVIFGVAGRMERYLLRWN